MALLILIAIIIVSLVSFSRGRGMFEALSLHPYSVVYQRKWYMLLTSGFIHADFSHLLFNMLSFFFFALPLERIVGGTAFLIIFFGSMILSDIPSVLKYKNDPAYRSLGASGGVSGVIFSYILYDPMSKIYLFLIPIGIPAALFAVLYLAYSYYAERAGQDHINHSAHMWGGITGAVITILLDPNALNIFFARLLS